MKEKEINEIIQKEHLDTNLISDGYHTFGELYDHRIALFIALCNMIPLNSWKSKKHYDGSTMEGWFIAGIGKTKGHQITYHLPLDKWSDLRSIPFDKAPAKWDGHTSKDVIKRLLEL
ncbi:MAG: WDGH domain-containing protein [Nitrosotalea sp.]